MHPNLSPFCPRYRTPNRNIRMEYPAKCTEGHEAGDKCICDACEIICRTFKRSPVYRVGGDEFAVISQDEDYARSEELVELITQHNEEALLNGGLIIACGMAKYDKETSVAEVFEAADRRMYENKKYLKTRKDNG